MASKILVIIDPMQENQPAFDRAIELANLVDAALHVVLFTDGINTELVALNKTNSSFEDENINFVRRCQLLLDDMTQPHIQKGLSITTEVKTFHRLHEAVIQLALSQDATLIFKPMRHHSLMRRTLFTSTDWNLIRTCPLPLLLVNDSKPLKGRDIVASVKFGNQDSDHDELNRIIMSQAVVIAKLFDSDVQMINAVPLPSIPMGFSATEAGGHQLVRGLEEDHRAQAIKLAEAFDLTEDNVTVVEGQAEIVVNRLTEQSNAGILILGSVARSGLAGLFIGNTAERVLEESTTDVLVLKQADFTSPFQESG